MTHSAFAVVTCLFECSDRNSDSATVRVDSPRREGHSANQDEESGLTADYDPVNLVGTVPRVNTLSCLSSKGVIVKFRIPLRNNNSSFYTV